MNLTDRIYDSQIGSLRLAATAEGLTHLVFENEDADPPRGDGSERGAAVLDETVAQLDRYFADGRFAFDLPLAARGTEFQRDVWSELAKIPWGETIAYAELARRVDRPTAVRAVGAANGANPISVVVPCHRVIGADGRLVGYGGGLEAKTFLLEHEGVAVADGRRVDAD